MAERQTTDLDREVGERLRQVRVAKRLALADVTRMSGGEFKSSPLGAYERGDRTISVRRLLALAAVYGVDPATMLPRGPDSLATPKLANLAEELDDIVFRIRIEVA